MRGAPPASFAALALLLLGVLATAAPESATPSDADRLARARSYLLHSSRTKRQKAFEILGQLSTPDAEQLLLQEFDQQEAGDLPLELWLDLFEAADHRGTPALKARLAQRRQQTAASNDPLAAFRECLEGGDADDGRSLFMEAPQAGCVRCHTVGDRGGQIGPDLTGLGQRIDRLYILESIIAPNASIVPGFDNVMLTLKNGETPSGLLSAETRDTVTLISIVDGKRTQIKSDTIASRLALPSPMPPGFAQALTKRELRDLVEFIATNTPE